MTAPDVFYRHIPETVVEGKRLGRHVRHDPRSLSYLAPQTSTPASALWAHRIAVLDQGNLGSCTGNAATGDLGTDPPFSTLTAKLLAGLVLDENEAVSLYSAATNLDSEPGSYPPTDTGSDGLSVAKAAKNAGLISGYTHITSIAAAQAAILSGPFITGTDWYEGFDNPDATGLVSISGNVRGGHEYVCIGYNHAAELWEFVNSWGTSYGLNGHFFYSTATFTALLAAQGDATVFVPINAPAPVPTPTPTPVPTPGPVASFPVSAVVAGRIHTAAVRTHLSDDGWVERHFDSYFGVNPNALRERAPLGHRLRRTLSVSRLRTITGSYSATQLAHARVLAAVVRARGLPERALVITLETAMTESNIKVYANVNNAASLRIPHDAVGSDHASVGIFQQQVPMWGSTSDCMDPAKSCTKFLNRLVSFNWAAMSNWDAAQQVQGSFDPTGGNYKRNDASARSLAAQLWATPPAPKPPPPVLEDDVSYAMVAVDKAECIRLKINWPGVFLVGGPVPIHVPHNEDVYAFLAVGIKADWTKPITVDQFNLLVAGGKAVTVK